MKGFFKLVLLWAALVCFFSASSMAAEYTCYRLKKPPVLDGKVMGDPAWADAVFSGGNFKLVGKEEPLAARQTYFLLGRTSEAIYLGVECEERGEVKAKLKDGQDLWTEDSVILFVNVPGQDGYYEFIISPIGSRVSSFARQPFDIGKWQGQASVGKGYWSAEIKVPFESIGGAPAAGAKWRLNITRNHPGQWMTWAKAMNYHEPDKFGFLVFADDIPAEARVKSEEWKADTESALTWMEWSQLKVIKSPYVQNVKKNGITVMWETNEPADSTVHYRGPDGAEKRVVDRKLATIHEVTLTGLAEETVYYYDISATMPPPGNGKRRHPVFASGATFKTAAKEGTPFCFAVVGDTRTYPKDYARVLDAVSAERPDFVINVGDIISWGGDEAYGQFETEFFAPGRSLMSRVPFYVAIGNHENNTPWFYRFLSYPGRENYYSFDYGNAHFVILDSNRDHEAQVAWLKEDLKSTNARWKFAFFHHPPYSSDLDDYGSEYTRLGDENIRKMFCPTLERYGVDVAFVGHVHEYERTYPIRNEKVDFKRGVVYVVTGGGGAELEVMAPHRSYFTAKVREGYSYCLVNMAGKTFNMVACDDEGRPFDFLRLGEEK